jgi:hypothetical protein
MNRILRSAVEIIAGAAVALVLTGAVDGVTQRPGLLQDGWSNPVQRPTAIYVGNGSAPRIGHLTWSSWTSASARGTGVLARVSPHCRQAWPRTCPVQRLRVTVTLSGVRQHGGQPYYSRMTWAFVNASGRHVAQPWKFATVPGGSIPAWNLASYAAPAAAGGDGQAA